MSHELTEREDGTAELAYLGEVPWHGLGRSIPHGATIEETQKAAGMDWEIRRSNMQYSAPVFNEFTGEPSVETLTVPKRVVLYRSDNLKPLSAVSAGFKEIQPQTALEFFRDMVEAGGYVMESAGTMRGGARMFASVKVNYDFELPGGDKVEGRLLFATACDGTMATIVKPMTIRVICANTMAAALTDGLYGIKVRHNTTFDASAVKKQLEEFDETFAAFRATARLLASTKISASWATDFLRELLPIAPLVEVEGTRGYRTIMGLFNGAGKGATLPSSNGTAWGMVNAVTEYIDHFARAGSGEARQESALFGVGDALKTRALMLASA